MHGPELVARTLLAIALLGPAAALQALESDRQQPLLVNADSTDGTLGDGTAVLRGNVEIRQGTLLVRADVAEVEKAEGRVRRVLLTGNPVLLQQEIEKEGLITAKARQITYQVATGIVTLVGSADVVHPQYHVSGEELIYDMDRQHFSGSGGDSNGRVRIELAPEVVPELDTIRGDAAEKPDVDAPGQPPGSEAENSGTENVGTENSGAENGGAENGGTENSGTENGGAENDDPRGGEAGDDDAAD